MKLAICVPTFDKWEAEFGHCLAITMTNIIQKRPDLGSLRLDRVEGTLINAARSDLVHNALEVGSTHILWMDCDMTFQPSNVYTLLDRTEPIVGVDYWKRRAPYKKVTKFFKNKQKKNTGVEEVRAIGFGLALMDIEVFKKVPEPWFDMPYIPEDKGYMGEDVYFCHKARKAGFKTYVDHDASEDIGHIGSFKFEDAMQNKSEKVS